MKKHLFRSLLAFVLLLASVGARAQVYTADSITAIRIVSMSHDSTHCSSMCSVNFLITIPGSFTGDSIRIVYLTGPLTGISYTLYNTLGLSTWNPDYMLSMYISWVRDDELVATAAFFDGSAIKIIRGTDTVFSGPNSFILPVTNPCDYGSVSGKVYIDNNSNCAYDAGDAPLTSMMVTSTASLSSPVVSINRSGYSNPTGVYSMNVQESWMTSYTVSLPPAYYFIFPISPCFSGAYTFTTLPQVNVDFPLQCTGNIDVQCGACSPVAVRALTPFFLNPYVSNTGCDSASGVLALIKDSRVIYDALLSYHPATSVSGDTLFWNYTNLTNLTSGGYWNSFLSQIHLTPDTSVHAGDTLCFRIYTDVLPADIDAANNDYSFCVPVVYSYDPNVKEVRPAGTGPEGYIADTTHDLTYTLHFQNTGSAVAFNIQVVDTLPPQVDSNKLRILGVSHTMSPEWLAPNVVRFNFNNIMLFDSAHYERGSHGFVRFKVNMDTGLAAGTQIKNKAYIYFDANPPVITNTALNTIRDTIPGQDPPPTRIKTVTTTNVKVYPNPATDHITVEHLANGKVIIMNVNGAVVMERDITNDRYSIDISKLQAGIYIVKTINKDNTATIKLIKQ